MVDDPDRLPPWVIGLELGQVAMQHAGHRLSLRMPIDNLLLPRLPLFLPGLLTRIRARYSGVLPRPCPLSRTSSRWVCA